MKRTQLKSSKLKPGKFKLTSCIFVAGLTAIAGQALALEYASVAESSAVLYDAPSTKAKKIVGATPEEQTIIDLIINGLSDGAEMLINSNLEASAFNQALTMLEITGSIRPTGANHWAL